MQVALSTCGPIPEPTMRPEDLHSPSSRRLVAAAVRLLGALSRKDMNLHVLKALQNMEAAAFFINWMLQGNHDFPLSWKAFADVFHPVAAKEGLTCEIDPNLPPVTRMRQALFLALAVSPLLLLCDITPMSNNLARLDMLRAWYHYGSDRPPVLRRTEGLLWKQLFAVARGTLSAIDALKLFVRDAASVVPLAGNEGNFFSPGVGTKANMPIGLTYLSSYASRRFVALTVAGALQSSPGSSTRTKNVTVSSTASRSLGSPDGDLLDVSSILTPDLWDTDDVDKTVPVRTRFRSSVIWPSSSSESAQSPSTAVESDEEWAEYSTARTTPVSPSSPANTMSVCKEFHAENFRVPPIFESQRRHTGVGSEAFLRSCRRKTPPVAVTLGSKREICFPVIFSTTWRKVRLRGSPYFLVSPDGRSSTYWPSFYDLDLFQRFIARSNLYQRTNGNEEHFTRLSCYRSADEAADKIISSLSGSPVLHVDVYTHRQYGALEATAKVASMLAQRIVVVRGTGTDLDVQSGLEIGLTRLGSIRSNRPLIDASLVVGNIPVKETIVQGSLHDFLGHVRSGNRGKILGFPCIPHPSAIHATLSLSTDQYALRHFSRSSAESGCPCTPQGMYWHAVATSDMSFIHDTTPFGFNIEYKVECGAVLVFVGIDARELDSAACTATFRAEEGSGFDYTPDVLGLLLHAGDRL
ncbi:hypothetical protein VNI00_013429 [Paramarasmius palmivorus]|uniref:TLDc domain-containing protein n=1 Tax=Paramarasmius palmivorus TaxID=297713 RepID=A0AAW0BZL0_9AGAR